MTASTPDQARARHEPLDVFLIPVGSDRHEPYCELPDDDAPDPAEDGQGWWARLHHHFRAVVSAEREHAHGPSPDAEPRSWFRRLEGRMRRWVAERVAEQRLLWHLRRCDAARLVYPADLQKPDAMRELRTALGRDALRHRRWLIVDSALLALTGILTLVPGPNLLFWFFAFRVVGHYLSWRGARHGLDTTHWQAEADDTLVDLRHALSLAPEEREQRVHSVALRLQLPHLARFFERIALRSA